MQEEKSVISNLIQAEYWQKRKLSHGTKFVLLAAAYFDNLETGNTLGSHSGDCAVGTAYTYIPCIPSQYASKLSHIHSVLFFLSSDRTKFGNLVIFQPFIEELNDLCKNGVELEHEEQKETIFFELVLMTGDNLGLNAILGFVECFHGTC